MKGQKIRNQKTINTNKENDLWKCRLDGQENARKINISRKKMVTLMVERLLEVDRG